MTCFVFDLTLRYLLINSLILFFGDFRSIIGDEGRCLDRYSVQFLIKRIWLAIITIILRLKSSQGQNMDGCPKKRFSLSFVTVLWDRLSAGAQRDNLKVYPRKKRLRQTAEGTPKQGGLGACSLIKYLKFQGLRNAIFLRFPQDILPK